MTFVTSNATLLIITFIFGVAAYGLAIGRIRSRVAVDGVKSHSLFKYYGVYAALWTLVPALLLALIWAFAADPLLLNAAEARLASAYPNLPASFLDLKLAQLQNVTAGYIDAPDDIMAAEAAALSESMDRVALARFLTLIFVMMIGFLFAFIRVAPQFKARVAFEGFLRRSFFAAAVLAILTTIGIVASLLFEASRFFSEISMIDFFFGTHWSPMVSLRDGAAAADEAQAGQGAVRAGASGVVGAARAVWGVAERARESAVERRRGRGSEHCEGAREHTSNGWMIEEAERIMDVLVAQCRR